MGGHLCLLNYIICQALFLSMFRPIIYPHICVMLPHRCPKYALNYLKCVENEGPLFDNVLKKGAIIYGSLPKYKQVQSKSRSYILGLAPVLGIEEP